MHFGRTCEAQFLAIASDLPPLPYRLLKKQLKAIFERRETQSVSGRTPEAVFFDNLSKVLRRVDAKWQLSARKCLFTVAHPKTVALMSKVMHKGVSTEQDPLQRAKALLAWAALAREGVRKIIKKFNKRLAAETNVGRTDVYPKCELAFMQGPICTQLESLERYSRAADYSAEHASSSLYCPVCLEPLFHPVAPPCGHAVCKPCFKQMCHAQIQSSMNRGPFEPVKPPPCPICRVPALKSAPVAVLGALAKQADPAAYSRRKLAEQDLADAKMAQKYQARISCHPMLVLQAE